MNRIVAFSAVWRDLSGGFTCVGSSCESGYGWKLVMVVKLDEDLQSYDEVVFYNSPGSISLSVEVSVGEFNPESDPSFLLSWLTAGTSVLELRIACFPV